MTWSPDKRPPMSCVILAAGRGSRLAGGVGVKPLVPVLGLPLLERTIVTASEAGLSEFFVVTGCQAPRVESFLSGLRLRRNLEISAIRNEAWEGGNAGSLLAARHVLDEDFVLLVADHVFDPAILRRLLGQHLEEGEIVLAVDFRVADNALVDVEDATKVAVRGQWVAAVGKELREYDAFDTGIFLCSPAILPAFEVSIREGDDSLAGGVRRLAEQRRARVLDIGDHSWVDIDTPTDLRKARVLLSGSLAKPDDGLISRTINRKLSGRLLTPLILRLAPGVSPNEVSALAFAVAIAAAAAFLLGQPVIGGLTVQLASVLDGCDGEIARLKKAESRFGSFFDAVLDRYADTFLLVGAGYYAWSAGDQSVLFGPYWSPLVVLVSILAASGNLLVSYTSAKSVAALGYRYRGRFMAAGRGRDLRLFVLFLGGVLTSVDPSTVLLALSLVALATNAVVVARTWTSWRLAQPAPPFVSAAALIFDFDGTIADTMPFLTKLAVDLLTQHYPVEPAAARKQYLETVGVDFASQLEELFPGHPKNEAVAAAFEAAKRAGILGCPVFSDVVGVLELLDRRGVKRFVCSSTTRELVLSYLRSHALEAWFDDCLGSEPGLGKARQVELILARHGIEPRKVVFVGDAPRDHELVRGTGVRFVGIRRLFDAREFRRRGLLSVDGLAGLTRSWERLERLRRRAEPRVGGQVSWFAQSKLADRRDKAESSARHEDAEIAAAAAARIAGSERRSAARIVQGDLAIAASRLQDMVENDHRWYGYENLALANWDEQQRVLALHLDAESWDLVSQSALALRGLTAGMQRTLGPGGPHEGEKVLPLSPTQLAGLRTMWDTASKAHRALAALAGAKPEPGLLHQGE